MAEHKQEVRNQGSDPGSARQVLRVGLGDFEHPVLFRKEEDSQAEECDGRGHELQICHRALEVQHGP